MRPMLPPCIAIGADPNERRDQEEPPMIESIKVQSSSTDRDQLRVRSAANVTKSSFQSQNVRFNSETSVFRAHTQPEMICTNAI